MTHAVRLGVYRAPQGRALRLQTSAPLHVPRPRRDTVRIQRDGSKPMLAATLRLVNRLLTNARIKTDQLDLVAFGIVEVQRPPLDPLVVLDFNCQPQTLQTLFF